MTFYVTTLDSTCVIDWVLGSIKLHTAIPVESSNTTINTRAAKAVSIWSLDQYSKQSA
ncbi:hypothetical protein M422DRAFT_260042 [Sphaerobolus stellatus SS14]|uniref:Uncharacterized protein n=1 Tax=Sphaerobolus stellatus (strain SS14) TaxID=990650 RepID=A0A0C9VIL5_SPHS4|nr:hypothetical protein M422DRAFT_260042 [Sphaerobolus stellatus SS14]